jgi:hypothetical protein
MGNIDIYIAEIENITNSMTDPYNHPFLQKDNTMYLSTISNFFLIQPNRILQDKNPSIVNPVS